ncbi:hypothetical protein GW17_00015518 [Ensete ventricosum]|nr:hypothetical protein GW17_00015518 [Ensete ventricosum]
MILPLENQDLSLLDICPVGATFLFTFFPLKVSETTIPVEYSVLLNNLCIVLPLQILLRMYPFHAEEKVPMLHGAEFRLPWDDHEHSIIRIHTLE